MMERDFFPLFPPMPPGLIQDLLFRTAEFAVAYIFHIYQLFSVISRDCFLFSLLHQVTSWLKKIYGDTIPRYEVYERTVDILHEVMEYNEERDKDVTLLIEDMKEQAAKYEEEGEFEVPFLSSTQDRLF